MMKVTKRVISLLTVMVFMLTAVFSMTVSAGVFSDVPDTESYAAAVNRLNTLGIINGYEDGTFKPLNNVTRAEFTAMLLRARGMGDIGSMELTDPPYPDVVSDDVAWAIGNIRTAKNLGIINGYEDGTFRPSDNVLLEEAVKMVVCAVGYENYSPEGAEWYTKYMTTAASIGLLKSVDGAVGTPATRACIAQILNNLLDTNVASNNQVTGNSTLKDSLGYTEKKGIIASNADTSLISPDISLRENEIYIIDDETKEAEIFTVENASAYYDMLGYRVTYYYKDNTETGGKDLSRAVQRDSVVIDVNAKDIETSESSASTLVYYKDGADKTSKANISTSSIVIYNGKLYGAGKSSSTFDDYYSEEGLPLVGSLKLIDNNNDGTYDVIFAEDYDVYFVSSTESSETGTKTVKDILTRNGDTVTITEKDMTYLNADGGSSSFSAVVKNSVIAVKKSSAYNGGEVLATVVVSKKTASGPVKGVKSGKSVTLGSTVYDYSPAAPWKNGRSSLLSEPQMNDNGTFYLDLNGDVIAYEKSETASNQLYGYIISADITQVSMEDTLKIKMYLPSTNKVDTYTCDDNTKINGVKKEATGIKSDLTTAASYQGQSAGATNNERSQLIKFSVKSGKVLEEIITAEKSDATEISSDVLTMSNAFSAAATSSTGSSKSQLKSGSKSVSLSNAVLINVPDDRSKSSDYKKVSTSDLETNKNIYYAEVYDLKGSEPKVVVFYKMSGLLGQVKADTTPFIITKMEGTQVDGEDVYEIEGYSGKSKTTVTSTSSSYSALGKLFRDNGGKGYVVRFGKDGDRVTFDENNVLFGNDYSLRSNVIANHKNAQGGWTRTSSGAYFLKGAVSGTTYHALWGYISDVGDTSITFLDKDDSDSSHLFTNYKSAFVLKYEKDGSDFNIVESSVDALEDAAKFGIATTPNEVFAYGTNNANISLIIIKAGENQFEYNDEPTEEPSEEPDDETSQEPGATDETEENSEA